MFTPIPYQFLCSVCQQQISGEVEDEEEFESPVFCPRCGRLNLIPTEFRSSDVDTETEQEEEDVETQNTRIAWRYRPETGTRAPFALRNCPAIDGSGRVIAAMGTELVALVPREAVCEVAWKFLAGDVIPGSPVIGSNGVTYAHSSNGFLHAIDQRRGPTQRRSHFCRRTNGSANRVDRV